MCNSFNGLFRINGNAKEREVGSSTVTELSATHAWSYKDSDDPVEMTLSVWGKRGETAAKILSDGDLVFVTGALHFREYKSKQYLTVQVNDYKKVSSGSSGGGGGKVSRKTLEDTPVAIDEELDADIPF